MMSGRKVCISMLLSFALAVTMLFSPVWTVAANADSSGGSESYRELDIGVEVDDETVVGAETVSYRFTTFEESLNYTLEISRFGFTGDGGELSASIRRADSDYLDNSWSVQEDTISIDDLSLDRGCDYILTLNTGVACGYTIKIGTYFWLDEKFDEITENIECEEIATDEAKSVDISESGEEVTFEFIPEVDGVYVFQSHGDIDTIGRVVTNRNTIAASDDDGYDANFKTSFNAKAGKTYYLQAKLYSSDSTGTFTVTLEKDYQFEPVPDDDSEIETIILDEEKDVSIDVKGGTATLKFVPEKNMTYVFSASSESGILGRVMYGSGAAGYNEETNNINDFSYTVSCYSGEVYYLQVRLRSDDETGTFTAKVTKPVPEVPAPDDDCDTIELNVEKTISFDETNNVVDMKFTAEADDVYAFYPDIMETETDFNYWILDEDKDVVSTGTVYWEDREYAVINASEGKTYYIQLRPAYGDFIGSLNCTLFVRNEDFEDISEEKTYPTIADGEEKDININVRDMTATFLFVPEESGDYIFSSASEDHYVRGNIVSDQNPEITDAGQDNNFVLKFSAVEGEKYYLQTRINNFQCGSYKVSLQKDNYPIGEVPEECSEISVDELVPVTIDEANGTATFKFVPEIEDRYALCVSSETPTRARVVSNGYVSSVEDNDGNVLNYNVQFVASEYDETYLQIRFKSADTGSFKILVSKVYDEYGVIPLDVEQISEGQEKEVALDNETLTKVFKFIPEEDGEYVFESSGEYDTKGAVVTDGTIYSTNDDGGYDYNFKLPFTAAAGETYYLISKMYSTGDSGNFTVSVKSSAIDINSDLYSDKLSVTYTNEYTYTGESIIPEFEVKYDGETLVEGTDYIVSEPDDSVSSGTHYVELEFIGKYEGYYNCEYYIVCEHKNPDGTDAYGDGTITAEPTCTKAGTREYVCAICGDTKEESIRALGHLWGTEVIVKQANSTEDGLKTLTCSRCDTTKEVVIPAYGDFNAPEYTWADDYSTVTATRVNKNDSSIVENETVPASVRTNTAATCTEPVTRLYTSGIFNNPAFEIQRKTINEGDPLGHDYKEVSGSAKEATCTEAGKEADMKCTRCGDQVTGKTIPALGHNLTKVAAKEATTSAEGNIEYWTCSVCGKFFSDAEGKTEISKDETVIPKKTGPTAEELAIAAAKENLNSSITDAKKIAQGNYTDDSYKALQDAITEAQALAASSTATKAQLDAAASKIAAAKSALKEKPTAEELALAAAKENLNSSITDAMKIAQGNYTDDSYKALQDAIKEAEALAASSTATKEQLDVAASKIAAARSTLKEKEDPKPVDPAPVDPAPVDPAPVDSAPVADRTEQKAADGTALGAGASAEAAEAAITGMKSDNDLPGALFNKLQLKSSKQTNTSISLSWKKVSGAKTYVIYGNKCGKKNKMQKIAVSKGKSLKVTKIQKKKVVKGTYYKFLIVALDKDNNVVSSSKIIHVATKGGKVGNVGKVTTKAKKNKVSIKKKKTFKLAGKQTPANKKLKVKKHRAISYESSNPKIATVTNKGVIKGKKKGTCYVYAYSQNGVFAKIKVVVK